MTAPTEGPGITAFAFPSMYPEHYLLVGVEDDPDDGSLRVYLGARYTGRHTHVIDAEVIARLRHWSAHTMVGPIPQSALCDCHPELTAALNQEPPA